MPATTFDIAVVGGGLVGLATALELSHQQDLTVVVLEQEPRLATHQSGHNSGVIHSGLYYTPGSAKARLCTSGRDALYEFCRAQGINHQRCGKVVVATAAHEIPLLESLQSRALANGLSGTRWLNATQLRDREPHICGLAALFVPQTGIVDFAEVAEAYARILRDNGGKIQTSARCCAVKRSNHLLVITTSAGEFACRLLINCAGLQADRVARLCSVRPELAIIPFRGDYIRLIRQRAHLVKHLVYPVPDPRFPFLGVHLTRSIHGHVEAGPTAVLAFKREGYHRLSCSLADVSEMLCYPGLWRLLARHWRTAGAEISRSFSRLLFVRAVRRLLPELVMTDVTTGQCGVRAQAVYPNGRLADDFVIHPQSDAIHVLNAPSPAATASRAIGAHIAALARRRFT